MANRTGHADVTVPQFRQWLLAVVLAQMMQFLRVELSAQKRFEIGILQPRGGVDIAQPCCLQLFVFVGVDVGRACWRHASECYVLGVVVGCVVCCGL